MSRPAYLIAARRTPVAPRGGAFKCVETHDLAAAAIKACLADGGIGPAEVEEIIVSNALGAGGNPARLAALASGLPERVAGLSIDRQCCGGLDALILADALIGSGKAEVVLAGGVESYSRRPLRLHTSPAGEAPVAYEQPPFTPWPGRDPDMAEAADAIARDLGIAREDQNAWAVDSHQKARASAGRLTAETVVIEGTGVRTDSYTRNLTPRHCARAPTIVGSITHANTSVAADGAAFCLVVSEAVAGSRGRAARRIVSGVTLGGSPERPGLAPLAAIEAAIQAAGLQAQDFGVAEIMEAFAVQAIACVAGAGLDPAIVNPGGGSLARGHPIGASGAILAVRLFHELRGRGGRGLAAIAAAGGLGTALILEADSSDG